MGGKNKNVSPYVVRKTMNGERSKRRREDGVRVVFTVPSIIVLANGQSIQMYTDRQTYLRIHGLKVTT